MKAHDDEWRLVEGFSSCLFLVSTWWACAYSESFAWKMTNAALVVASFLCNASAYRKCFLIADYAAISAVALSYLQSPAASVVYSFVCLHDLRRGGVGEHAKNAVFLIAISKSCWRTYWLIDRRVFAWLLLSTSTGALAYRWRYWLLSQGVDQYRRLLTWYFHGCITVILSISSLTC